MSGGVSSSYELEFENGRLRSYELGVKSWE